jgi:hypothetical protein
VEMACPLTFNIISNIFALNLPLMFTFYSFPSLWWSFFLLSFIFSLIK